MAEVAVGAGFFTAGVIYPIIAGAALGQVFATFYDAVKQAMGGSLTEFKPLKDLKATLDMLKPMLMHSIEEHNKQLCLSNDAVKDLKREMEEGKELVMNLAKCKSLQQRLTRLRYSRRLREVDQSIKALIEELKLQETRDVKEVLKLVRGQSDKLEELLRLVKMQQQSGDSEEEDVKETLTLATKQQVRLTRLICMQQEVKSVMEVVQEEVDSEGNSP